MKSIARSFVYWPGIDNEIEEFVRNCNPCCVAGKSPTKTTLESWPAPSKPWSRIHIDYAGPVDGTYFLVVVDPFSKWPEVFATRTTTAKTTTRLLSESFTTFGIPETIVSDNGPQFAGHEFQSFCQSLGIQHLRTAPYHPQSNGLAERFVDTVKRSLRKIRSGGESLDNALRTFLQVYRTTPTNDLDGKSPAEVMFGRPIRTISSLMLPLSECSSPSTEKAEKQNASFNKKHGAISKNFQPGDSIYVQVHQANSWKWEAATVIERIGKVNYNVFLVDKQRLIRSHANQLKRRAADPIRTCEPTPLSVFVDEFGLSTTTTTIRQPVRDPEPDSDDSEYFSESGSDEETAPQPIVNIRPRRTIQLPARFEPYYLN